MGILSDFFVADRSLAAKVADDFGELREYPHVEAKGVDPVKLMSLHGLITGEDPGVLGPEYEQPEAEGVEGDSFVYVISDDFLTGLAKLDVAGRKRAAQGWSATEGLRLDGWTAEETETLLADIVGLAEKTVSMQRSLMVRMSL